MKTNRPWQAHEDDRIRGLLREGWTTWEVAAALHETLERTQRAVDSRARRLREMDDG